MTELVMNAATQALYDDDDVLFRVIDIYEGGAERLRALADRWHTLDARQCEELVAGIEWRIAELRYHADNKAGRRRCACKECASIFPPSAQPYADETAHPQPAGDVVPFPSRQE